MLCQDRAKRAGESDLVFDAAGQELRSAPGRVLFFTPLPKRGAVALHDNALEGTAIPYRRPHGVKLMVWDRHVPPRPFWEQSWRVVSNVSPAGL
jgi:hypothetical protein